MSLSLFVWQAMVVINAYRISFQQCFHLFLLVFAVSSVFLIILLGRFTISFSVCFANFTDRAIIYNIVFHMSFVQVTKISELTFHHKGLEQIFSWQKDPAKSALRLVAVSPCPSCWLKVARPGVLRSRWAACPACWWPQADLNTCAWTGWNRTSTYCNPDSWASNNHPSQCPPSFMKSIHCKPLGSHSFRVCLSALMG